MSISDELYREFEEWHASQVRPMSSMEAAWAFIEQYNLNVCPVDLVNYGVDKHFESV
jgi:hypothetical protein